ncbi:hypothetical protein OBBRIDRAFT_839627 [Obba rivulosa]|uniref:BTB domain-containing protein n=1 Tax=Obba rivulosa TaxID=1052685 RepID=A0A8E2AJJ2_9APHY|nr:hypothetical protein OBBRIDRAFT_839627 [Obba rivulosa]
MEYPDFVQLPIELQNGLTDTGPGDRMRQDASIETLTLVDAPATGSTDDMPSSVSVSATFHPQAELDPAEPDLTLVSSDSVFFYVHIHRLERASANQFCSLLTPAALLSAGAGSCAGPPLFALTEPAETLNLVLHAAYGLPCAHFRPALPAVRGALSALDKYGLPRALVGPTQPLFELLRALAPAAPLDTYALAAAQDLEPLAAAVSPHLLAFALPTLSDNAATAIGSKYLLRLLSLHCNRTETLKRLLRAPPASHAPAASCGEHEQQVLMRAWALASSQLMWDVKPSTSTHAIQIAFRKIEESLPCKACVDCLDRRVKELVADWAAVKRTI